MIGFCTSPRFLEHQTSPQHPERPDRIRAIARAVREAGLVRSADPFPDFRIELGLKPLGVHPLKELEFSAAEESALGLVHTPRHIESVKRVCEAGGGVLDLGDTPVGPGSYEIALFAVGAVLRACDAVVTGEVKRAFVAVRPPGHHAEPDRSMGFCLFSNIAIAARYLQKKHGVGRIGIVDFDVHHGNGTQAAFEADDSVLFISLHQHPRTCYPGSGYEYERGTGRGEGFTLNLPVMPGADDAVYLELFDQRVIPKLDEFRPEMLLVSAGFDAHQDDPLAQVELSEEGFEQMTRKLVSAAEVHCRGKLVSVLEGGYNLRALGRSVVRHLAAMSSQSNPPC